MHLVHSSHHATTLVSALLAIFMAMLTPDRVFAGPPLLCRAIQIGNMKTLAGGDGPFGTDKSYDRTRLIQETLALLTPTTSVLVRMETLRRATIYASNYLSAMESRKPVAPEDRKLASGLLLQLKSRAHDSENDPSGHALALFDLGYLSECYKQAALGEEGTSGYDLMSHALEIRGDDAAMHFACALVAIWPRRPEYETHLSKAKAGADKGSLLASNLTVHFPQK